MCIRDRFQRFLQQSLNSAEPPPRLPFVSSNLLDTLGNQPFSQGQNSVRPTNESTESPFEIDRPLPAGWLQPRLWTSLSSYRKFLLTRPLFLSAFFILNITSAAHFKLVSICWFRAVHNDGRCGPILRYTAESYHVFTGH